MDYTKFSCTFTVRRLLRDDIPSIFALCEKNPQFYEHCPPFVTPEKIEADMKAMPQRKAGQESEARSSLSCVPVWRNGIINTFVWVMWMETNKADRSG